MPRHLHFDCFSGISGDMMLGALVDLGLDPAELEKGLRGLPIGPLRLSAEKVDRSGITGTKVHVEVDEEPRPRPDREKEHPHGHSYHAPHLKDIIAKVEAAGLAPRVTQRAVAAYRLIAEAEAKVHGAAVEKIHFHEVGANDAIVDVAGAMLGVELLGIESFSASAVAVGSGTVQCAHGLMPVPVPATAELLRGLPTRPGGVEGELTTPTGAAILRVLAGDAVGRLVPIEIERIGYGAGSRRIPGHPNHLRLFLGRAAAASSALPVKTEEILVLETEIDDMSPEVSGHLMDRLLAAGALDVQFSPVQMKKNRPGQRLRALATPARGDRLAEIIFRETSTFGLRVTRAERLCLERRSGAVQTPLGPIAVKLGLWDGRVLKVSPEYESCRAAAEAGGRPLIEIYDLVRRAIAETYPPGSAPPDASE